MKSKSFNIPKVGKVVVAKHARSRRITLSIKPGQAPKVVIPKLMTYQMGLSFAIEKTDWIIEHAKKMAKRVPQKPLFNESNYFQTRFSIIRFNIQGNNLSVNKQENEVTLNFPEETNFDSDKTQSTIKNFIIEVLRTEAKAYLIPRTKMIAEKHGFKYNNIFIKNLKSRWGSCSSANNINLNLHLMCLPEYLSDFIILHELCHTIHKNHGQKFHELLNKITGNEKLLNKELRKYSIDTLI